MLYFLMFLFILTKSTSDNAIFKKFNTLLNIKKTFLSIYLALKIFYCVVLLSLIIYLNYKLHYIDYEFDIVSYEDFALCLIVFNFIMIFFKIYTCAKLYKKQKFGFKYYYKNNVLTNKNIFIAIILLETIALSNLIIRLENILMNLENDGNSNLLNASSGESESETYNAHCSLDSSSNTSFEKTHDLSSSIFDLSNTLNDGTSDSEQEDVTQSDEDDMNYVFKCINIIKQHSVDLYSDHKQGMTFEEIQQQISQLHEFDNNHFIDCK